MASASVTSLLIKVPSMFSRLPHHRKAALLASSQTVGDIMCLHCNCSASLLHGHTCHQHLRHSPKELQLLLEATLIAWWHSMAHSLCSALWLASALCMRQLRPEYTRRGGPHKGQFGPKSCLIIGRRPSLPGSSRLQTACVL